MMNDEMRYAAVLKELGEVLQDKNTTISCQKWQIDQLKEKLAAAEKELADAKEELAQNAQMYVELAQKMEKGGAA